MKQLQIGKSDLTDGLHPNVSNTTECFYFHLNLNETFLICLNSIEAVGPYPNAPNSRRCFQIYPKLEWRFLVGPNLITAVAITTWFQFIQGQFLFYHRKQKEWQNSLRLFCCFGLYFAVDLAMGWLLFCLSWENRHHLTYMWM